MEGGTVPYVVTVASAMPFDRVELLVNGEVVETGPGLADTGTTTLSGELDLPTGGWVAARALGGETRWPSMDSYPFAHASPVWIGERGSVDPSAAAQAARELLGALEVARQRLVAGYGAVEIPNLTARFDAARDRLERLAEGR